MGPGVDQAFKKQCFLSKKERIGRSSLIPVSENITVGEQKRAQVNAFLHFLCVFSRGSNKIYGKCLEIRSAREVEFKKETQYNFGT